MNKRHATCIAAFALSIAMPGMALAQAAGAGADFNKADRKNAEIQRIINYDKPVKKDPLGNALIGGGVTGLIKGSAGAAVQSVVTGTATGAAVEKAKEEAKKK